MSIRFPSTFAWSVVDAEIVLGLLLSLSYLSLVELGGFHEIFQVFVVRKNSYGVRGSMAMVVPYLEGCDICQEFLAMDLGVLFCLFHLL